MEVQFDFLTEQVRDWQERRFTVLSGTITLVVAIVSFVLSQRRDKWSRQEAAALVMMIAACACLVTWYAGWVNQTMGTFLEVYSNDPARSTWQAANNEMKERSWLQAQVNLNRVFGLTYAICVLGSCTLLWKHCSRRPTKTAWTIFLATLATCTASFLLLFHGMFDSGWYRSAWQAIRAATPP